MGKIADALEKYGKERKTVNLSGLTKADLEVLMAYDRNSGSLLNRNPETGRVENRSFEVLKNKDTFERLLEKGLIFPGGKLTPYGLQECERLRSFMKISRPKSGDNEPIRSEQENGKSPSAAFTEPDQASPSLPPVNEAATFPLSQADEMDVPNAGERVKSTDAVAGASTSIAAIRLDPPAMSAPAVRRQRFTEAPEAGQNPKTGGDQIDRIAEKTQMSVEALEPNAGKQQAQAAPDRSSIDETKVDKTLVSMLEPQSYAGEQFKLLRTNILYPLSGAPPRSILVTSAMPGEGKSFVAANLAVSIALNINRYVLLIDCDLRKPNLHRTFGFSRVPGLSEYLSDGIDLAPLLLKTRVEKLTLLPGGTPPQNPSELMSSEKMAELMEEVKHRYNDRLIVIDSPPYSMAAETGVLTRQVDGVLLVSRYRKTPREDLKDLIERMGPQKIIGVAVNSIESRPSRYYRYHQYGGNGKS